MTTEIQPLVVDYAGAGKLLGVSGSTVRRLCNAGELPTVRMITSVRIRVADVEAYLKRRSEESKALNDAK